MATDLPLVYGQNARPVGFPLSFRLTGDRLTIDSIRTVDEIQLGATEMVRLTYEPRSVARRAFKTSVTLRDGRRFALTSVSWKGMTRADEQADEYRAFVMALLLAIGRASPQARFAAGKPALVWYGMVALAAAALLGFALFAGRAFASGAPEAGFLGLAIMAGGLWQAGPFVRRNQPGVFRPEAPPARLLP